MEYKCRSQNESFSWMISGSFYVLILNRTTPVFKVKRNLLKGYRYHDILGRLVSNYHEATWDVSA